MSPPKIIIATLMREHGETGVQTYFNTFHRYLEDQSIFSRIITPFSLNKLITLPIFGLRKLIDPFNGEVSVWWYRYWHYLLLKQAMKKNLKKLDEPNNVIFFTQCPLSAKAALEVRTSHQQKVIMTVHFNVSQADEWVSKEKIAFDGWLYRRIKKLESEIIPNLDGIIYVSQFMKEMIEKHIPESRIIKSAILSPFVLQPEPQGTIPEKRDLINVGTLEPRKNQSYILSVLAEAKKRGYQYSLTLVGDGPSRENLKKLALSLGIADQVTFAGFQPNASKLFYQYRAYVHSALLENRPVVILEALAFSLPILAGNTGGIPECFSDGIEGFYWALDDPADGAEKLIKLMESSTTYFSMQQAARKRFEASFSQDVLACKTLEFLTA